MRVSELFDFNFNIIHPLHVDLNLVRNIVLRHTDLMNGSSDKLIDFLPNLQSLAMDCGNHYISPDVKDRLPELKTYMERYLSRSPKRFIGGYDFLAGTKFHCLESLITVWRGRGQSFKLISDVDIRVRHEGGCIAVGRFDFASKKLKVVRCDDSEVIIEIVLDRLEY